MRISQRPAGIIQELFNSSAIQCTPSNHIVSAAHCSCLAFAKCPSMTGGCAGRQRSTTAADSATPQPPQGAPTCTCRLNTRIHYACIRPFSRLSALSHSLSRSTTSVASVVIGQRCARVGGVDSACLKRGENRRTEERGTASYPSTERDVPVPTHRPLVLLVVVDSVRLQVVVVV